MNRVEAAIQRMEKHVTSGNHTPEKLEQTSKSLDMQLDEYVRFQELKSLAFAEGKLTEDEAMTIYGYLGNSLETFNRQPVAVKAVLTKIFSELLSKRIGAMQTA